MSIHDSGAFILEISRQDNKIAMSCFARNELASTIKHYNELTISILEISTLCNEVTSLLNKTNKKGSKNADLMTGLKKTGQLLWDTLLTKQVKNMLMSVKIKELVLSLDEELIDIPWEILYDGNEFFCLRFNMGRVVRTKEKPHTFRYRSAGSVLKMLILANPTNDLKSAYLEGVNIRNRFDRRRKHIRIDFKSTDIDTLYVKKNMRDYDIVHFAGHCEYENNDPESTGWVLSDGRFTTRDVLALSESLPLPNLIFSNTCHSASTTTDLIHADYQKKTYSLAAAFLFSGVRHYIGTIWQVEDRMSLVFAKEFYNYLIKGSSIGECIRLGRLKLAKEYGTGDISWANYILYGDPNFILFGPNESTPSIVKIKKAVLLYRRLLIKFVCAIVIIFIFFYFYAHASMKNPTTYLLFMKSDSLLKKGKNEAVIALSKSIVKDSPLFLEAYSLLAQAYERLGDRDNSLKYYFEYALYSQRNHDSKSLASAYIGIGWIYQSLGEYPKAFDFYNKAIKQSKEYHDELHEAIALRKLAVWYIDKEDYNRALELLMKSLEINRERQHMYEHRYNLACDYFDIGLLFSDKDDYITARKFYKKSQVLFEKMKLNNELSDYYFNLGELHLFEKEYDKALECYFKGLKIDQMHDNRPNVASDFNMIGELYMEMDNFVEAEKFFSKSLLLCQKIKAYPELAAVYYNLANLYKQAGDKKKTGEFLRNAQEIYRDIDTPVYQRIKQEISSLNET